VFLSGGLHSSLLNLKFVQTFGGYLVADFDGFDPDAPDDKIGEPVHILWNLLLFKVYVTEAELSSMWGIDEDMFHSWAWHKSLIP
jgi:hypothetical protein